MFWFATCGGNLLFTTPHRDAFCQFSFQWIYYYGSNKSTRKETGKMHLCGCPAPMIGYYHAKRMSVNPGSLVQGPLGEINNYFIR